MAIQQGRGKPQGNIIGWFLNSTFSTNLYWSCVTARCCCTHSDTARRRPADHCANGRCDGHGTGTVSSPSGNAGHGTA